MDKSTVCIACSIFKNELEVLCKKGAIKMPVVYLDSMLHMKPEKLDVALSSEIEKHGNERIILAYGECHPGMINLEQHPDIRRLPGVNCCSILLGAERYRQLVKEGAFFLINEWVSRWKQILREELGLSRPDIARLFMNEMHSKLVYIDTGSGEIPRDSLDDISEYCGLPWQAETCSTAGFARSINDLFAGFDNE
jgi:hypothetical protein